jgi:hypothetical protein
MGRSITPPPNVLFAALALVCVCSLIAATVERPHAAELKPKTVEDFDRYVGTTETRMADDVRVGRYLVVDGLPEEARGAAYETLRQGGVFIQRSQAIEEDPVPVSGGLVHHWVGVVFVPGASLNRVLAVLQDYEHYAAVFGPGVQQSRLIRREGDRFTVFLRVYKKSIVTVVLNTTFDDLYSRPTPGRVMNRSLSTRIAEVENAGSKNEHELPVGDDSGFLWRLNNYWRLEERDQGVYMQVESVGLTRNIPFLFRWLVTPLVSRIPREVLNDLLVQTRRAVLR